MGAVVGVPQVERRAGPQLPCPVDVHAIEGAQILFRDIAVVSPDVVIDLAAGFVVSLSRVLRIVGNVSYRDCPPSAIGRLQPKGEVRVRISSVSQGRVDAGVVEQSVLVAVVLRDYLPMPVVGSRPGSYGLVEGAPVLAIQTHLHAGEPGSAVLDPPADAVVVGPVLRDLDFVVLVCGRR